MAMRTLAFEIGTEELPAFDLHAATLKLEGIVRSAFDAEGIPVGGIEVYSTPRRLAVVVEGVPERTEKIEEVFRGPAAKIAFDADGNPTKAALGFARGKGVDASALERRDENGVEYVYAVKQTPERDVAELLPGILGGVITTIQWPKAQRWGSRSEQFSRPVRWLLALFGDEVVPVEFAGLVAGDTTRGHRFLSPGPHKVADARSYVDVLRGAYVVPSEAEREERIRAQVREAEQKVGLVAELPAKIMEEVVNLAEYPTVMVGSFDELFLAVPRRSPLTPCSCISAISRCSTPTAPWRTSSSSPRTVTPPSRRISSTATSASSRRVSMTPSSSTTRISRRLGDYVERLDEVVFQESLGTMRAKTNRIVSLAAHLADDAGLCEQDAADAVRAAELCKADLVTGAVVEFTSVQGTMGYYYALASGENEQVAHAIGDHYRPRFSGDEPPASLVGKVVATADKLDTICGLFAVGQGPTGSSDPFALRRSAIGIMSMLFAEVDPLPVSLASAIDASLATLVEGGLSFDVDSVRDEVIDFFITRAKVMMRDEGNNADAIDAVLACDVAEPLEFVRRVRALEQARRGQRESFR